MSSVLHTEYIYICLYVSFLLLLVQGSEPKTEKSLVSCFMSSELTPFWLFRTASNTYEQSEKNNCKNSEPNATACYRGSKVKQRITLKLRLNYDGKDELTTSAFRCGSKVGTILEEECWIIMITIDHRQGKKTTQNPNNKNLLFTRFD